MTSYMPPDALFLAPPHSHDPCDVSHVAALPQSMLQQLPESVQTALWTLQESTSIMYASYVRLEELISERFDRLIPLPFSPGSAMMKCESMHGSPPEECPANLTKIPRGLTSIMSTIVRLSSDTWSRMRSLIGGTRHPEPD